MGRPTVLFMTSKFKDPYKFFEDFINEVTVIDLTVSAVQGTVQKKSVISEPVVSTKAPTDY